MTIEQKDSIKDLPDPLGVLRTGSQFLMMSGYRGSGKSTLGAFYSYWAYKNGCKVYSMNNTLSFGESLDMDMLLNLDEELNGSVLFLDEFQTLGSDSLRSTSSMGFIISQLLYQIRKRDLVIIANTQNYYKTISSRVQYQVNWVIDCTFKKEIDTIYFKSTHTGSNEIPAGLTRTGHLFRASRYFDLFNTKQVADPYAQFNVTSDSIRENQEQNIINRVFEALNYLNKNEGLEELEFPEIRNIVTSIGLNVTDNKLGRWLRRRVAVRKSGQRKYYDITNLESS